MVGFLWLNEIKKINSITSWWLNQPICLKFVQVKLDQFPRDSGENKTYLSCHHLVIFHQPRLPWNKGISLPKAKGWGRYNLTRRIMPHNHGSCRSNKKQLQDWYIPSQSNFSGKDSFFSQTFFVFCEHSFKLPSLIIMDHWKESFWKSYQICCLSCWEVSRNTQNCQPWKLHLYSRKPWCPDMCCDAKNDMFSRIIICKFLGFVRI